MFLLKWYKEWLTIKNENRVCQSCETLKQQLEIANYEKAQLLEKVITTPTKEPERTIAPEPQAVRPKTIPWNVRRQMLEAEDREKARVMREAPKPDSIADVDALEKEMEIAAASREAEASRL